MLYILNKDRVTIATWHVGQKNPIPDSALRNVEMVQADGDEREALIRHGYPYNPQNSITKLYGDFARNFVLNL